MYIVTMELLKSCCDVQVVRSIQESTGSPGNRSLGTGTTQGPGQPRGRWMDAAIRGGEFLDPSGIAFINSDWLIRVPKLFVITSSWFLLFLVLC